MAAKIFINYRRDDTIAIAGRLHDRLAEAFGRDNLFMDVDNIPVGINFEDYLNNQVAQCDAMLSVIGPSWVNAKDETNQRRLDKPDDFVAIEIAAALARSNILVIPVLVDGTHMPKASELPASLKPLALRNAIQVRNTNFGSDAEQLITKLREALALGRPDRPQDFVMLSANAHLVATFMLSIFAFLIPVGVFFMKSNNFAGALAAFVAAALISVVGWRTLARDQSVRMFGLITCIGGLLALAAMIGSGQFLGVSFFADPTVQNSSMMVAVYFMISAMFFGSDQYAKGGWGPEWAKKMLVRQANSPWMSALTFLASMIFVSGTWVILYRLTDSMAAALALASVQLLITVYCYVQYRKALAANPGAASS